MKFSFTLYALQENEEVSLQINTQMPCILDYTLNI